MLRRRTKEEDGDATFCCLATHIYMRGLAAKTPIRQLGLYYLNDKGQPKDHVINAPGRAYDLSPSEAEVLAERSDEYLEYTRTMAEDKHVAHCIVRSCGLPGMPCAGSILH